MQVTGWQEAHCSKTKNKGVVQGGLGGETETRHFLLQKLENLDKANRKSGLSREDQGKRECSRLELANRIQMDKIF